MPLKKKPKSFGSRAGYVHPDISPEKSHPAGLKPLLLVLTALFALRGLMLTIGGDWLFRTPAGLGETLPDTLHARVLGNLYLLWAWLVHQARKDPARNLAIIQGTWVGLVLLVATGVVAAASGAMSHPALYLRPLVLAVLAMLLFLYKPVRL